MSRDLQEGPTAAEIERDAAYYKEHRNTGNIHAAEIDDDGLDSAVAAADALAKVRCFACGNTRLPSNPPTIAVFVEGGLIQDICFDGQVRVVVIDSDVDTDDGDNIGIYTNPATGHASRVWATIWERGEYADDPIQVRAALRAAGEI